MIIHNCHLFVFPSVNDEGGCCIQQQINDDLCINFCPRPFQCTHRKQPKKVGGSFVWIENSDNYEDSLNHSVTKTVKKSPSEYGTN